jgi:hypothetical protein
MTDETQADETPKRGRPRKRSVKREPLHKGSHHDDGYGDRIEEKRAVPPPVTQPRRRAIRSNVITPET